MFDLIVGAALLACLCMIALGVVVLVFGGADTKRGGGMWLVRWLILLAVVLLAGAVLGGCAPPPEHVTAPAWMLTPVPTVDIGVDALNVWDCQTAPETVCTEWHSPVTN